MPSNANLKRPLVVPFLLVVLVACVAECFRHSESYNAVDAKVIHRSSNTAVVLLTNRTASDYYYWIRAVLVDKSGQLVKGPGDPAARYSLGGTFLEAHSETNQPLTIPPREQYATSFTISYEKALGKTEITIMRKFADVGLPYPFYPRGLVVYRVPELQ